ncbi:ABC transporter permease [Kallotenue papyrolyticum]|uniref:ABC transporter permease n=1 Tax=Kallotenue papyrolyticum TaxID=1325125 RepID=UPI000472E026|nr:ABC transporter permease [Kallotenue papyrolyticum]
MDLQQPRSIDVEMTPAGQVAPLPEQAAGPRRRRRWWDGLLHNRKAAVGALILLLFMAMAILAPWLAPGNPGDFVARPHRPPSREHWLGTTGQGQDVFAQIVHGARVSLGIGFATGLLVTLIGAAIGMTAGYFGGRVDDVLSLLINVFLIIPSLPLLVTLASYLQPGPLAIMFVLAFTGWAWPARVLRSQTLSLREKDFVSAALVSGESSPRIIFGEILPNMTSIVVASFFGSTIYAIGAEAALEFLGLGNVSTVSWGTILFWAQNNAGLLTGAWWTFVPAGLCIALVAFAFAMINFAVDEVTNPRLRAEKEIRSVLDQRDFRPGRPTPVLRASGAPAAGRARPAR